VPPARSSDQSAEHHARPIRRWAFFGLAVLIGLACIRLGFWQLDRLASRQAINASAQAQLDRPQVILPQGLAEAESLDYRRATASGVFDPGHEIYLTSRPQDGIAGVHVVTPLLLAEDGPALLVDRGWLADADYRSLPPESWAMDGPTEVSGFLLPSQGEPALAFLADRIPQAGEPALRDWRALSIPGIRRQIRYPILDVYLMQESAAPHAGAPRPSPELDLSEGSHLGYAVQWFAFAAIALIGAGIWLWRGPRARR
jgi:surfeit locus 1 family protein